MKDAYTTAFHGIVRETQEKHGYELPVDLEHYVVMLLAVHIDKSNFLPQDSFAESYLKLQRPARLEAKELGDTCLFVTGVFPSLGERKGIKRSYYANIGKTSYSLVSETMNVTLFSSLSKHFDFLSNFIEIVIHSSKQQNYNLFR